MFIHTDHCTFSLILICCCNLLGTILTECKVYVSHNVSCVLVVLMSVDLFAFVCKLEQNDFFVLLKYW